MKMQRMGKKAPSIFLKFKHFVKKSFFSLFFKRLLFRVLFLQNAALITSLTAYLICIKSFDSISTTTVLPNVIIIQITLQICGDVQVGFQQVCVTFMETTKAGNTVYSN